MSSSPLPAFFDKEQAATYDERFAKLAPMRDAIHLITAAVFSELPSRARILCVGAGTGAEILFLARRFPDWQFTAVEPAAAMLEICKRRAAEEGIADRCTFHEGYLDTLPPAEEFHAATSILVSQFILDPGERRGFFAGIAARLLPGGYLVSADLSADLSSPEGENILAMWLRLMGSTEMPPEQIARMREAYNRDVAITPAGEIEALMMSGGFDRPVPMLQALLIRAWFARRAESIS